MREAGKRLGESMCMVTCAPRAEPDRTVRPAYAPCLALSGRRTIRPSVLPARPARCEGASPVRVISLGSGSSGNSLLVQAGETSVLVDAGFQARLLAGRLRSVGVAPASLSAILLTHEHGDHACGALSLACQYGIPILSDPRTIDALLKQPTREARPADWTPDRVELPAGRSAQVGSLEIRAFAISHDAVAPCGFKLATS